MAGDERVSDRGLHYRPALASKNKLVPISTLQPTGFPSNAVAESYDQGSWAASVSQTGTFDTDVTTYNIIRCDQTGGYTAKESHDT